MWSTGDRPDYVRSFQRGIAQIVLLFYGVLLIPVGYTTYQLIAGDQDDLLPDGGRLAVWGVAFAPMTAGAVAAVRIFRSTDRQRTWRLAAWAAGLFAVGAGLIAAEAIIRN